MNVIHYQRELALAMVNLIFNAFDIESKTPDNLILMLTTKRLDNIEYDKSFLYLFLTKLNEIIGGDALMIVQLNYAQETQRMIDDVMKAHTVDDFLQLVDKYLPDGSEIDKALFRADLDDLRDSIINISEYEKMLDSINKYIELNPLEAA